MAMQGPSSGIGGITGTNPVLEQSTSGLPVWGPRSAVFSLLATGGSGGVVTPTQGQIYPLGRN